MNKPQIKPNPARQHSQAWDAVRELVTIFLFFAGLALIAAGLWQIWPPLALVFLGIACLYLAGCVNLAAKSPERTVKK